MCEKQEWQGDHSPEGSTMKITIETAVNGWLIRTQPDFPEDRSELYVLLESAAKRG